MKTEIRILKYEKIISELWDFRWYICIILESLKCVGGWVETEKKIFNII